MGEGAGGQKNWLPNPTQTLSPSPGPCHYPTPRRNLDDTQPAPQHPPPALVQTQVSSPRPTAGPAHPVELTWRVAWVAPQRGLRPQVRRPQVSRRREWPLQRSAPNAAPRATAQAGSGEGAEVGGTLLLTYPEQPSGGPSHPSRGPCAKRTWPQKRPPPRPIEPRISPLVGRRAPQPVPIGWL